ncbi:MAG: hypothetical protein Unbinned2819contig1000_34 [Prokaryotic dsDNA virus sp.]|nr:MAG: hypothetical protein Unbinned2819contig1000_34 [Prokaryotic dsDNA virus sp.]
MTTSSNDLFAAARYSVEFGTPAFRVAQPSQGDSGIRTVDKSIGRVAWNSETQEAIGLVGPAQTIVQPSVTVGVFEELLDRGYVDADHLSCQSWNGGADLMIKARTGRVGEINTKRKVGEAIAHQIVVLDNFIGRRNQVTKSEDLVLVCTNGMTRSVVHAGSRLRHTKSITDRFQQTVIAIRREMDGFDKQIEQLQKLADSPLNDRGFQAILDEWFPRDEGGERTTRSQNQADLVERLYHTGAGADPGSLWGAYQAATNYITHHRGRDGSREIQNVAGTGESLNREILTGLIARAEAAAAL